MKYFSVKFKACGHLVKATVVARNILRARHMMDTMYPKLLEDIGCMASIHLLCYR